MGAGPTSCFVCRNHLVALTGLRQAAIPRKLRWIRAQGWCLRAALRNVEKPSSISQLQKNRSHRKTRWIRALSLELEGFESASVRARSHAALSGARRSCFRARPLASGALEAAPTSLPRVPARTRRPWHRSEEACVRARSHAAPSWAPKLEKVDSLAAQKCPSFSRRQIGNVLA